MTTRLPRPTSAGNARGPAAAATRYERDQCARELGLLIAVHVDVGTGGAT